MLTENQQQINKTIKTAQKQGKSQEECLMIAGGLKVKGCRGDEESFYPEVKGHSLHAQVQ